MKEKIQLKKDGKVYFEYYTSERIMYLERLAEWSVEKKPEMTLKERFDFIYAIYRKHKSNGLKIY